MPQDFLVNRQDLGEVQLSDVQKPELADNSALIKVDRFAFTANNVTYGVAGDIIGYWNFFPASDGQGRIPVWGIGSVVESNTQGVKVGDRYYGYFPMSTYLLVEPTGASPRGFTDGSAHRAELPVVYNQYSLMNEDNGFEARYDNHYMIYRPLFTTSYVLDDYFADDDFFGAQQMILGSASSKTAFGLAFMLAKRDKVKTVGLTSVGNKAFVESMGLYDSVLTYDEVEKLEQVPSAYVDMAGNRQVLSRVHHHLADNLVNSCGVGITHWESRDGEALAELPGARPSMFFAPTQIVKRNEELGPAVYQQQLAEATNEFLEKVDDWVAIEEHPFSDVETVYRTVLNGASPDKAYVVVG